MSIEEKKRQLIVKQQENKNIDNKSTGRINIPKNEDKRQVFNKQQQEDSLTNKSYSNKTGEVNPRKLESIIRDQEYSKRNLNNDRKNDVYYSNQEYDYQRQVNLIKKQNAEKEKFEKRAANGETVIFTEEVKDTIQHEDESQYTQEIPILGAKLKKSIFKTRTKKPNFVIGVILNTIYLSFVAIVVALSVGLGTVMGVANAYLETTPELDTAKIENQKETSYIFDPEGLPLHTYAGTENRDLAAIEEIPLDLQNAIIAIEDVRFRKHQGVDFRRLVGAFFSNVSSGSSEGGSTLTQQLVKNKLLTNERSYKRKLQEATLAMELEKKYTKDEILESYLNTIPLGGLVYGVKTAAKDYFNKELSELTLKEIVCIAAITQNPHKYNPRTVTYRKPEDLGELINRMNQVTERMRWNDFITDEQYQEAYIPYEVYSQPGYIDTWKQDMNILEQSPANSLYEAPHFVEYVIYDVQTALLRKEGLEDTKENRNKVDKKMRSEGYRIYSTYDKEIQDILQTTVSEWDDYPAFKYKKYNTVKSKDNNGNIIEVPQPQVAATVVENETGYIRAIVGSRDEPTKMRTLNRAYQGQMPVGSSIKPLSVYGPAFDIGYGPGSGVANLKVPITGWDSKEGYPITSTGEEGCIPLRKAVVSSLNIAAGRTLMDYVGIDTSVEYLKKLGVKEENIIKTPVGLSMGGSPVTPIQMAGAYSTIARGGEYFEPVSFTKVLDSKGNVVIDNTSTDRIRNTAFKPSTAWMLTDVLVDAATNGTGRRAKLDNITTAGKTGTVVDNKGVFFSGYTPYYTSSLWVGHDEYIGFVGGTAASNSTAPMWKSYMTQIHEVKGKTEDKPIIPGEPEDFNITKQAVCGISNMLPSGSCTNVFTDYYYIPDIPTETCDQCSGGGVSYEICASSDMAFVHGVCPPEQYATRYIPRYPEGSPYNYRGSAGAPPPCTFAHNPWEGWDVVPPA